jgi:predicted ester cyclase
MPRDNKAVVRAYVEAFNRGDVEAVCRQFTPDALVWGVLGFAPIEKARAVWRMLMDSLQIQLTIESIIGEGDLVAVRYTERGKSARPFMGHEPTGEMYKVVAMEWFELKDGLIHRRWGARDSASQMKQMGLPV